MIASGHSAFDLADPAAIAAIVVAGHNGQPWAAVINGDAYTAVDKTEADQVAAWAVNALAPEAFGAACATARIQLVQISTDYAFAGNRLGGELALRTSGAKYAIVRTAWAVSAYGSIS